MYVHRSGLVELGGGQNSGIIYKPVQLLPAFGAR